MRYVNKLLSIVLLIMLLISTGCGQKNSQQQPKSQLKPGGELVYGSIQEPNTLNPLLSDLLATAEVGRLIFSGLVTTDDKLGWIPDLAVEVPTLQNGGVSADGLTVTYKLRPGVLWHDGIEFTAADVKFTWQMIMDPKVHVVSRDGYDRIASIATPDKYTVVVRFKQFYAPYLTLFSTVLPQHILGSVDDINKAGFNRAPVGTGPFKFKDWRIAEAILLTANPSYYRGKPNLDGITYKVIPDANILLAQLKTGELDIASNLSFAQIDQVRAINNVRVVVTPSMIWEHLDFNLDRHLFQDVRVRQAIALAIDRPGMVNSILKDAAVAAASDQHPASWAYNPTLQPAPRDIAKAKELLTQAGYKPGPDGIMAKDGQRLTFSLMTTSGNKVRETVAQNIAQQLQEIGIAVEVKLVDVPVFFGDVLKNRRFDTALFAWVAGRDPDNLSLWNSRKIPSSANGYEGQNYPGWRNPEVDRLTLQGSETVNLEQRKQIYFRIQDLIVQEVPVIPLYFRANIDAVKTKVLNYKPTPTAVGSLWNAWEWGFAAK